MNNFYRFCKANQRRNSQHKLLAIRTVNINHLQLVVADCKMQSRWYGERGMVPSLVPWDARNAIVCAVVGDLDKRDDPENHAKDGEETCTAGKSVILLDLFNFVFVLAFRSTLPHEIAAAAAQAVHECLDQGDNTSTRGAEQEDDARDAKARETKQKKTCQTQPPPAKVETTDAKRAPH